MGPVKEGWSVDYAPLIDDTEIHSFEEWESVQSMDLPVHHRKRTVGLWTAIATLAVALVVAAGYGYSVISKSNAEIARLSARVDSFSGVPQQVNGLEASLNNWNTRQGRLEAHIEKIDSDWNLGLNNARLRSAELVAYAHRKEHEALNQRTADLNAQIADVAFREHQQQAHVAQLENELADARQELAFAKASYAHQLAAFHQQQISSQREISSISNVLSTNQIDFQAEKNHDVEVVQGVSLHLTGTDLTHQRFGGWIWIAANRRRIWIRNHPAELPVVFYPQRGGEAYELIVTKVNRGGAAGYIVVRGNAIGPQQDVASNGKSIMAVPGQGTF